jgi:hypothetical protein
VGDVLDCLSHQEAQDLVRHCLEQGKIRLGKHFREELAAENLSFEDAWGILRTGLIYDPAEQDLKDRRMEVSCRGT